MLECRGAPSTGLAAADVPPGRDARVMVIVAHPDDETTGTGARLGTYAEPLVVLVTDGAPRRGTDAEQAGCTSVADCALLRRRELATALALAGLSTTHVVELGYRDQGASAQMGEAARTLADLIGERRPDVVLT